MTFQQDKVSAFTEMFEQRKKMIREFEGCERLELLQDIHKENVFFTYSFWLGEEHLNNYRHSELFKDTWSLTKEMFSDRPAAWSLSQQEVLT